MATVTDYESVTPNSNDLKLVSAVYDFAVDAGAQGVLDMVIFNAPMVIHRAWIKVLTAVTSASAPELIIGVKGGDTDAVLQTTLKAALGANVVLSGDAASNNLYVASGGIISMTIGVADLTAGKFKLVMEVSKFL